MLYTQIPVFVTFQKDTAGFYLVVKIDKTYDLRANIGIGFVASQELFSPDCYAYP